MRDRESSVRANAVRAMGRIAPLDGEDAEKAIARLKLIQADPNESDFMKDEAKWAISELISR